VREEELAIVRQVDVALSYSDTEISILECLVGSQGKVMLAPWVQEVCPNAVPFAERAGLAFLGSFRHPPNLEAMELFAQDVLPMLASRDPALKLHVYGAHAIEALGHIATPALVPEGFAPDLAQMFAKHRIFVAPLATGAGIKGKVISALAHGIPAILSPAAAEGVGVTHEHNCLIARTAAEWIAAIARLNGDPELWARIAANGQALVAERFPFSEGASVMRRAFEAAELYLPLETSA
jgi:glycosyltransferase involved in cell wall biosynthesis